MHWCGWHPLHNDYKPWWKLHRLISSSSSMQPFIRIFNIERNTHPVYVAWWWNIVPPPVLQRQNSLPISGQNSTSFCRRFCRLLSSSSINITLIMPFIQFNDRSTFWPCRFIVEGIIKVSYFNTPVAGFIFLLKIYPVFRYFQSHTFDVAVCFAGWKRRQRPLPLHYRPPGKVYDRFPVPAVTDSERSFFTVYQSVHYSILYMGLYRQRGAL